LLKQTLKNIIPDSVKSFIKRILIPGPEYGWFGKYPTWADAEKRSVGYDNSLILETVKSAVLKVKNGEAVYERDGVIFDKIAYEEPLLDALNKYVKNNNGILNVVDFGGSLGSSYFQYKGLIKDIKDLSWNVVEQPHFVACGNESIADDNLRFYSTIDEAIKNKKAGVLYLGSVIQYFEKPFELIEKCIQYDFDLIIVDRTAFIENTSDRITIQVVPEDIYKASYPCWFFNERKFTDAFKSKYVVVSDYVSEVTRPERLRDNKRVYWKGFIMKKITKNE
jgi:putative methyltransferase (TIGR04325 family)